MPRKEGFQRPRHMTLIELLIVIAILALVMGVVSLNIGSAVKTERFRASVTILVDKLRLAQDIMLILRTSVRVKLEQKKDGLHCTLITEGALTPALAKAASETTVIQPIKALRFISDGGKVYSDSVTLDFLSAGSRMSRGILSVASDRADSDKTMREQIYLPGFPVAIKTGAPNSEDLEPSSQDLFELYPPEVRIEEQKRNDQKQAPFPSP